MANISFNGSIFYDSSNGAGYTFTPDSMIEEMIEVTPDIGVGYWLKEGNTEPAEHSLSLRFRVSSLSSLKSSIDGMQGSVGTLVLPDWGSFPKCTLSGIGGWKKQNSNNSKFLVWVNLTFRQYP